MGKKKHYKEFRRLSQDLQSMSAADVRINRLHSEGVKQFKVRGKGVQATELPSEFRKYNIGQYVANHYRTMKKLYVRKGRSAVEKYAALIPKRLRVA